MIKTSQLENDFSIQPLNIRFNRLRVSHSLPDLSKSENSTTPSTRTETAENSAKPTGSGEKSKDNSPERKFVPISSAPPPQSNDIIFVKPVVPIRHRVWNSMRHFEEKKPQLQKPPIKKKVSNIKKSPKSREFGKRTCEASKNLFRFLYLSLINPLLEVQTMKWWLKCNL